MYLMEESETIKETETAEEEFEAYTKTFTAFFSLSKDKIQKAIDLINTEGSKINYAKFVKAVGLPEGSFTLAILDTLGFLSHLKLAHAEGLEEELQKSKLPPAVKDGMRHFLEKIEKKGLEGLNLRFWAYQTGIDRPLLKSISSKTMLLEVEDESGEILGFIPVMRIHFQFEDEDGRVTSQDIQIPVEKFDTVISSFEGMHEQARETTSKLQKKLGDSLLYSGGD